MKSRSSLVVGGAVIDDVGRVLIAQRAYPPRFFGKWELPGGGVNHGETPEQALARELFEELRLDVVVGCQIGVDLALSKKRKIRFFAVRLLRFDQRPVRREHLALRWVTVDELCDVDWLPVDELVLPDLKQVMNGG